jgi:rhamnopyranosyl-N-acetylglucosaminyl-diphospho-decaprenol beta-1,3/1,4-galactofuranosyltransferase
MDKVIAVVVTYNRQQLLSECVEALRNQSRKLDKILIINNGSTDRTQEWVTSQSDLECITQANVGSGGGFHTGIKWAFENGYSWIWLMDDDGYPEQKALEYLLEDDQEELMVRNCAVINKEDRKSFVWKTKNYKTIDDVDQTIIPGVAHPFNGTLLHRRIVERVGLPIDKLFLWGDETEYLYRIVKLNAIPYVTVGKSIHYHPAANYTYKADWNFGSNWKMYFYIRNRLSIMRSEFGNNMAVVYTMYMLFLSVFAARLLVFQKSDKFRKLAFMFWPIKDALTKNFNATPTVIMQRLQHKPATPWAFLESYYRTVRGLVTGVSTSRRLSELGEAKAS